MTRAQSLLYQVLFSLCCSFVSPLAVRTNRKAFLTTVASGGGACLSWLLTPNNAQAAPPITEGESESIGARALRMFRPNPPRVLRPKLNKDFAVLLMRSSYNTLDELDCVAMDQFQRDFFLIRQGT